MLPCVVGTLSLSLLLLLPGVGSLALSLSLALVSEPPLELAEALPEPSGVDPPQPRASTAVRGSV
jgi:hypothetical protein